MAVILVAFIFVLAGLWSRTSLVVAQTCIDEGRFKEQVLYVGQQGPSYQLNCPLESGQSHLKLSWLKNCQRLDSQEGKAYLKFANLSLADQGNYTCQQQGNSTASFTVHLIVKESQCSKAPTFEPNGGQTRLWGDVGSTVKLNCTALLLGDEKQCDTTLHWSKDGQPLSNHTLLLQNTSSWFSGAGLLMVSSLLTITLREQEDFGLYSCTVRNVSADFSVEIIKKPSHTAAVIAAIVLLLLLAAAAFVYSRYHLNIKLWYRNSYGDYELNDGKLYDAYISYVNNDYDRKFVNFILKPHLENKNGYKLHLNENDILPGAEPSAELLMNMSPEVKQKLNEHQHSLTILTWKHNSVTPSSVFWKELALAMPRRVIFHSENAGDPQTMLQDDKDPMLTLDPDYLDCRSDTDPAGDLGLRLPVYKALACKAPVLPAAPIMEVDPKPSDIDVSDLGSRNYGTRSDFYCLVTEEHI
ncbi:single Ig IL-1-related receptor isoform X3 [Scomber japonicus]|uniref:single Ig IL-1-related receptor isoform X3 n=1 Tax=Scomber japonicus TaxID=13676 RepID=UPI002304E2EB|nr:single Ig IL-1-related receptor isoform X3 [Scomber japonicus]